MFKWRASVWAQNSIAADRTREVLVSPLEDWQIFYYRGGAWSNPLSSAGTAVPSAANVGAVVGVTTGAASTAIPDGVRLVLTLPTGQAITGKLTMDWVAPR